MALTFRCISDGMVFEAGSSDILPRLSDALSISVQAEKKKIANPTFPNVFDPSVDMAGHFPPSDVVFSYHRSPLGPRS